MGAIAHDVECSDRPQWASARWPVVVTCCKQPPNHRRDHDLWYPVGFYFLCMPTACRVTCASHLFRVCPAHYRCAAKYIHNYIVLLLSAFPFPLPHIQSMGVSANPWDTPHSCDAAVTARLWFLVHSLHSQRHLGQLETVISIIHIHLPSGGSRGEADGEGGKHLHCRQT